ncbi:MULTISPECIES: ABC transporter permease [Actinoplanes]|uniref:ABC transporter permease n=1 Tax=Actinoplanes TaxID=1865 RepID=UPI0005F27A84|nr:MULTISPECIES: ABC transporter permease [Actinoplanes]GLY07734.1 ABC transporter permease [Actinoplanes sp. NBRC 101535]
MRRTRHVDLDQGRIRLRIPRLRWADLFVEASLSVLRHPGRSLATVIGTILGAAAFVASLGLGTTLNQQVSSAFDSRRATEVMVQPETGVTSASWLEETALSRLRRLNGVVHAGRRTVLSDRPIARTVDQAATAPSFPVIGADPAAVRVMAPELTVGRVYDDFQERHATPVVLLSEPAARRLSITRAGVAVFLDDRAYTVMGIYRDVARRPEAMAAVIMPYAVATALSDSTAAPDVLIETAPGAAQLISRQAPLALRPEAPADLRATAPPDPRTLRDDVESSVTESTVMISAAALLIGTVSIGNAATAGIAARTGEIGLRRAVGGRRRHIFLQLILETGALGALGGTIGVFLGVLATCVVSLANGWTPVIGISSALAACAVSTVAGMLAGLIPATRAARIPPVQALQR